MSPRPYLSQLDALRGIAALGVAGFFHIRMVYSQSNGLTPLSAFEPFYWLQFHGYLFVDLFFVISGVVFTHNYLEKGRMRAGVTFSNFLQARLARLYPLHLFTLLVLASWEMNLPQNTLEAFFAHLLFLNALVAPATQTFNGPAWSLSVEMFCYLVFALAALKGRVGWAALASIAVGLILAIDQSTPAFSQVGLFVRGFFGFFIGYALSRYVLDNRALSNLVLICSPLAVIPFFLGGLPQTLGFSLIVWPCLITWSLRLSFLNHSAFKWLGDRSYSIYLVHWPIYVLFAKVVGLFEISLGWWGQFVVIGIVLLASDTTYRAIEVPAKLWMRQKFGIERALT